MDETYQTYLNRVARMTLPTARAVKIEHIQESPKFMPRPGGVRVAAPFPGYSIISPPWQDDGGNDATYPALQRAQEEIVTMLGADAFARVPAPSFHLTLADLIWNGAYREASRHSEFDERLHGCVTEIFDRHQPQLSGGVIGWQVLGLVVMTRAIAVALAPTHEESYDRVIALRRAIYQNSQLVSLGIEQQYFFTAHVTLGYFGRIGADVDRHRLNDTLSAASHQWLDEIPPLQIDRAELRKFDDMTHYYRERDWPVLKF